MNEPNFINTETPSTTATDRLEDGLLPLINVVFLLLMFFLIAGIIMQDTLPPLPDAAESDSSTEPTLDLVILADGSLEMQGEPVSSGALADRLPEYDPDNRLRVGAHRELTMENLEQRFADLAEAGHPDVVLLTDQQP